MQTNARYLAVMRQRMELAAPGRFGVLLDDMAQVAASPAGRRVLRAIVDRCGVFREPEALDAQAHLWMGERNIGLFVIMLTRLANAGEGLFLNENMEHGHE